MGAGIRSCPRLGCGQEVSLADKEASDDLARCPTCRHAFCWVCGGTWHGKTQHCKMPSNCSELVRVYLRGGDEAEGIVRRYGVAGIERVSAPARAELRRRLD